MPVWLIGVLISVALDVIAYLIAPHNETPQGVQDLQAPTASANKPVYVLFGSARIMDPNVLWYGQASTNTYTTSGGSGGK